MSQQPSRVFFFFKIKQIDGIGLPSAKRLESEKVEKIDENFFPRKVEAGVVE